MGHGQIQRFGGNWTEEKLALLQKYLSAYTTALKNQPFELVYIDAFAGTGYVEAKEAEPEGDLLFADLADSESQGFLEGSARIALQVEPAFDQYVFIEKSPRRFEELGKLRNEFEAYADRISLVKTDSNDYLQSICRKWDWRGRRAVLFLDPSGMQVDWATIEAIASTRAIDVWILFPLGIGVGRLVRRDGEIPETWKARLDRIFGTREWYDRFYQHGPPAGLFGQPVGRRRPNILETISQFYNERLGCVFADVADNPRRLCNSRGNPLFLLCFAVGNPRGAKLAIGIAQHILKG